MSQADIYLVTEKLEYHKKAFQALVGLKKNPEVVEKRNKHKKAISNLGRALKELYELEKKAKS